MIFDLPHFLGSVFGTLKGLTFAEPLWFLLIPILGAVFLGLWWVRRKNVKPGVLAASLGAFEEVAQKRRLPLLRHSGPVLRILAVLLVVFALARPQAGRRQGSRSTEGIDIMLVIDTSGSMKARDFEIGGERPNRLEVIKKVIADFIEARPDDRIGIVVFGTEAFTQAPLTLDHEVLIRFLDQIEIGVAGEATAIGDGLATAVSRLKDQDGDSKVVVLLTDGANNAGRMDPYAAIEAAKAYGARVYTVGVGSKGDVPIVSNGQVVYIRADIDEKLLTKISDDTGGMYRRASDTKSLREVYEEIDRMEKKKIEAKDQSTGQDYFMVPLLFAALALVLEGLWSGSRWRVLP